MLLITIALKKHYSHIRWELSIFELFILGALSVVTMFLCYSFFIYLSNSYGDINYVSRAANYINWIYQLTLLILVPIILCRLRIKIFKKILRYYQQSVYVLLALLMLSVLSFDNNSKLIFDDLYSGRYAHFKKEMQKRYKKIYNIQNNKDWKLVIVDEITDKPNTIFTGPDLGFEKFKQNSYINYSIYYERFFSIDEIRISSDTSNILEKIRNYE